MTKRKLMTESEPGHGFTREDWDEVMDHPEVTTDAELAEFRPFAEVHPELAAAINAELARRGPSRPRAEAPKAAASLRLDPRRG